MRRRAPVLVALVALLATGCTAPRPPLVVTNPDPSVKIPAFKKAVHRKDRAATRQLVQDLDSDDPAVRFYAIGALERLTGQQLGYHYYEDEAGRAAAVGRWQNWLAGRETVADIRPETRAAAERDE